MEQSEILNKVIRLGNLLIKELRQKGRRDTLGRWMAFYIAEKMTAAQTKNTEQKLRLKNPKWEPFSEFGSTAGNFSQNPGRLIASERKAFQPS